MIDCPICHVRNNDDARFCAECGQRLGGPAQTAASPPAAVQPTVAPAMPPATPPNPAPAPSQSTPAAEPKISAVRPKLRSPLLEEFDDDGYEETVEPPDLHAPRGGALKSPLLGGGTSGGGGLHSPLLDRSGGGGGGARSSRPAQPDHLHEDGHHHSGLRSPLLGGAAHTYDDEPDQQESHHHSGLRSPLLGGTSHDEDGGHHLHSPLLDRGGHAGPDRRQNAQPYGGTERRGGLRSPILGGGGGNDYYYDEPEDEEPLDEDNPNVLRSPLLAAKRPVIDRPRVQTPPGSNAHGVPRPSTPQDSTQIGVAAQAPNPYANVQPAPPSPAVQPAAPAMMHAPAMQSPAAQAPAPNSQQFPQNVPPQFAPQSAPPAAAAPSPVQAALQQLPQPTMQPVQPTAPQPTQPQPAPAAAPPQAPTNVPAAFQNLQSGLPAAQPMAEPGSLAASVANSAVLGSASFTANPSASYPQPTANPATPPVANTATPNAVPPPVIQDVRKTVPPSSSLTSATNAINVLPPKPGTISSPSGIPAIEQPTKPRGTSKMLSGGYDEDEDIEQPHQFSANRFGAPAADPRQQSPIFKIVGAIAIVLLLAKFYTVTMFFGTDYKTVFFMVVDQLVGLVTLLCLMLVCFNAKS